MPYYSVKAQEEFAETEFEEEGKPKLFDSNLKIATIAEGLSTPTTMAFVGPGDILVSSMLMLLIPLKDACVE